MMLYHLYLSALISQQVLDAVSPRESPKDIVLLPDHESEYAPVWEERGIHGSCVRVFPIAITSCPLWSLHGSD
jgi:hypothetical protein